ncbi:InlB B-repeat-containing protein [Cohnella boryungensis]|uniref:InlB B-repeat-containing protein n=2 Tax=Cohnella boryungensis TaxID=768479 RepID=A0ABV8SCR9_9BACL
MLIISIVMGVLPVQQAKAAELPVQQAIAPELSVQQAAASEPSGFQDVRPTDWFYEAAVYVQKNGIFSGTGGGLFSPKGTMTRAMYVTALGRMAGVDVSEYSASSFADVPAGIWYAPYVAWAVKKGIAGGTGGRNFSPDATVSREQMATLILRYFESYQIPYQSSNRITTEPSDLANVSSWAADAVVKLWQAGLFAGDSNGNFNPHGQASRAEAAILFMRSNAVVEAWANQNQEAAEPTPTPTSGVGGNSGGSGGNNGNSGGGNEGSAGIEYTLKFESNGGTEIADQKVRQGKALNQLPAPAKEGYIFQGWFRDSDLSLIFAEGSTVTSDTKLYAKYIDSVSNAVQSIPSYSVLDVAPGFTIAVNDATGSLTASEVQEGMTFEDTANADFAGITVTGANGLFTVTSAAEDGKFVEGNTYQLTLTDDNLSFQDQDATTSIFVFSVAKEEVMNIPLNPNMIYLPFADVTDMMLDGAEVGSPAIPVVTTTVGGSESGLAAANAGSGTFAYTGSEAIQVGDTVAIYEGVRPDQRTVDTTGAADGEVAYVQITAINGSTYTYDHADAKQVLFKPDVLPVSVEADTDGDPDNHSITVAHTAMNYSDSQYAKLGLSELTTVDVGDFIAFYEGETIEDASGVIGYGRITSITPVAERDVIAYTDATEEDIAHVFDVYQQQAIDGDLLLSDEEIAQLEDQIKQQAIASGFVDQAANYLSALAMETNAFKTQMEVNMLSASKGAGKVSVENLTVVPSLGTKVKHIAGQTSGVSATLQIGADIVIRIHEESDLVIHMTGTFLQEISLNLGVNGETAWGEACLWGLCVPYPSDYRITANLDAYTYTGINIKAEIATVEHDKLQAALADWDKANNNGMLGKVLNIATEIQALIDGVQDTGVDAESLKEQYKKMMENETDWVPLIKKKLFEQSMRVVFGIVEVKFEANFVVSANVNLTIGADFNYKTAKRFSVTIHVLDFSGSSSTVSLPGDGDYQFTFYVMGTIGLRAGVLLELKAGVGSVELNSIGLSAEPGAYVNLWGYFYYQLKNINGKQSTRSSGALYVELGIYLEIAVGAQLGDGMLSASAPLYENTWPLYTVGQQHNVTDFAYPQDDTLGVNLAGKATSIAVPEQWLTMSTFDLKSGKSSSEAYPPANFDIQIDNPNFRYNPTTQIIEVVNTSLAVDTGNLVITWKSAPLSFTSDPLKRTIPLTWLARAGDYSLQLDPRNGGLTQVFSHAYNAAINVKEPTYQGYTFDGWYTFAAGGVKVTLPSRMPARDYSLYAHWIANTDTPYTVEHYLIDPNTRSASAPAYTEKLTGTTGAKIQITSDRFRDLGYAEGKVSGVPIKNDGSTVVRIDYYPTNRTMTFDWGYAGAPSSTITEQFGKNIAARIPLPTRAGYTFTGWSQDVPSMMPTVDTTYTASWLARTDTPYQVVHLQQNIADNTYTVVDRESYRGTTDTVASLVGTTPKVYEGFAYDPTAAGMVQTATIAGNGSTVLKLYYKRISYEMKLKYNSADVADQTVDVPFGATTERYLGAPAWQGRTFAGWSPAPPTTMPAGNVELTAEWTLNTYAVSFNSNGAAEEVTAQTVGYGYPASEPLEPTKNGYVFDGWYSDSGLTNGYDFTTLVTDNITLYAKWLRSYTVSFNSNDGSAVAGQTVSEGYKATAPEAPTLEGYVFSGWYSDSGLTNAYDFTTTVVTANITLYAKWTVKQKNRYTVSFNSNGGTEVAEKTVEEGAVATVPTAPTREGYTFAGWYSDSGLLSSYGFTAAVMESITLYAKWTMNSYTVSFNGNGGSAVDAVTVEYRGTAVEPVAPTRAGYTFGGWYSDIGLANKYNFSTLVTANLTLYAKWTAVNTVSFISNDGSAVADQTVEFGGRVMEPAAPTRTGYTFDGWYNDSSLTEAYGFTTAVTTNLTLYAKWTINVYEVLYDRNDGSEVVDATVEYGGRAVEPAPPTRANYTFGGWYSNSALTEAYSFMTPITANLTLYAKWTINAYTVSFDSSGGSAVTSQTVNHGDAAEAPNVPIWSGYAFEGWYTDMDLDETNAYDFTAAVTADITLYAKWRGLAWRQVGEVKPAGEGLKLAVDSQGTLYSASIETGSYNLTVRKLEAGVWEQIGDANDFPELRGFNSLILDSQGTPYIVYQKNVGSSVNATVVKKYNGAIWEELGNTEIYSSWVSIAFDSDDAPYIAYMGWRQMAAAGVKKYDGSNWVNLSGGEEVFNKAYYYNAPNLMIDENNIPYVLYQYYDGIMSNANLRTVLVKYQNGAWQTVSTINFNTSNLDKPGYTFRFADDPSNKLYMIDYENRSIFGQTTTNLTVSQYNGSGWQTVGIPNFALLSTQTVADQKVSINFDSYGTPYVSYLDAAEGVKLTVRKYDGQDWVVVGDAGFSAGGADKLHHVIDKDGNIYVIYADQTNGNNVTVMKHNPSW